MLAPAASGPSRSWDPSTAVEGGESAKAGLCQEEGNDRPHDNNTLTSDAPIPLQPIINVASAGILRSSLDTEHTGKYSSRPQGEDDIV